MKNVLFIRLNRLNTISSFNSVGDGAEIRINFLK